MSRPGKATWQEKVREGQTELLKALLDQHKADGNERMVATLHNLSAFEGLEA